MKPHNSKDGNSNFSPLSFLFGFLAVILVFGVVIWFLFSRKCGNSFDVDSTCRKPKKKLDYAEELNTRQIKVLDILREKQEVTVSDLMKNVKNVSERTLRRDMNFLEKLGYCKKAGSTKGSKYILCE